MNLINTSELSIIYVIYNDFELLKSTLKYSIDLNPKEIIIVDNSPQKQDENIFSYSDIITYFPNEGNSGYSGGVNIGLEIVSEDCEWALILNADAFLEKNYIECINQSLIKNSIELGNLGAISGKILKYDFILNEQTKYIDSTGIMLNDNGIAFDRGQGELDKGQYDKDQFVFGACGASVIYNLKSIKKKMGDLKIMDEKYFSYKEDVDLSIRFNSKNLKTWYCHQAIAHHGRGMGKINKINIFSFIKKKRSQNQFLKVLSTSNQWYMLIKNRRYLFSGQLSVLKTIIRNILMIFFMLIFDFNTLLKSVKRLDELFKDKVEKY